jgi:hypothetical protein
LRSAGCFETLTALVARGDLNERGMPSLLRLGGGDGEKEAPLRVRQRAPGESRNARTRQNPCSAQRLASAGVAAVGDGAVEDGGDAYGLLLIDELVDDAVTAHAQRTQAVQPSSYGDAAPPGRACAGLVDQHSGAIRRA